MRRDSRGRTGRSVFAPVCAIGSLWVCLALAPASCLNPATDDQPSATSLVVPVGNTSVPEPSKAPNAQSAPPALGAGAAAPGQGEVDGLIDNAPEDSASQPDAGAPADAGPDAEPPVVGQ